MPRRCAFATLLLLIRHTLFRHAALHCYRADTPIAAAFAFER